MCGIAGFISKKSGEEDELRIRVRRMSDRLVHRGPDDAGAWVDPKSGVALGFQFAKVLHNVARDFQGALGRCSMLTQVTFNILPETLCALAAVFVKSLDEGRRGSPSALQGLAADTQSRDATDSRCLFPVESSA